MVATNWDVLADGWVSFQNGTSKFGNGQGPRLQSGRATGTDDYDNRFYIGFTKPSGFTIGTAASVIAYLKVRGSNGCFGQGSNPKLLVRRSLNADLTPGENNSSTECGITTNGTVDATRWGGYDTTATHQAFWEGTPSTGDVIAIDVTTLYNDWVAARTTGNHFTLVFWPSNAAGNAEEQISGRKIAFHSADSDGQAMFDGGNGPYIAVTPAVVGVAPNAPTLTSPANASHVTQPSSIRALGFTYTHPDGTAGTDYEVQVATDLAMTSLVADKTVALAMANNAAVSFNLNTVSDFAPDEVRGTTYYWRVRTRASGLWGAYSTVRSYIVNRVPIITKVRPA